MAHFFGDMTISITTLSIKFVLHLCFGYTGCRYAVFHYACVFILSVVIACCHYAECRYTDCHIENLLYAECCHTEFHFDNFHYAECGYAECR